MCYPFITYSRGSKAAVVVKNVVTKGTAGETAWALGIVERGSLADPTIHPRIK